MFTFTKKWEREAYPATPAKEVCVKSNEETLSEVILDFEHFLRGCGYHFDGRLDFVEEDE